MCWLSVSEAYDTHYVTRQKINNTRLHNRLPTIGGKKTQKKRVKKTRKKKKYTKKRKTRRSKKSTRRRKLK